MKKIISSLFALIIFFSMSNAQQKQHKVVFEITTSGTADHRAVLRQVNNVLKDAPGTRIELVCHGSAIFMLVKDKTVLAAEMETLSAKGVQFAACANSMRKNNLEKSQLVTPAGVVPNGVLEVVSKEEDGWSYIKAGR